MYRSLLWLVSIHASTVLSVPLGASSVETSLQAMSTSSSVLQTSTTDPTGKITGSNSRDANPNQETDPSNAGFSNELAWSQKVMSNAGLLSDVDEPTEITSDEEVFDPKYPKLSETPSTDEGLIPNPKWPMGLGHPHKSSGGWSRQANVDVFPISTSMAGVLMHLETGGIRELHWHTSAEWAYQLKGTTMVTTVDAEGRVFADAVEEGDLWYFPAGLPHSLQATGDDPSEFLLVFDSGTFSEQATFQLTDWTAHLPKEVLAKNFQVKEEAFDRIPDKQLYIFPGDPPPADQKPPESPSGYSPANFTYKLSKAPVTQLSGGTIKIFDPSVFEVATTVVGAIVTVEPGAMRELHWHPTEPEWDYFLTGEGRMSLFASSATANTFDYRAGDIGYVPASWGHYIENTGNSTLTYLELFNADKVEDISLHQWLALTPPSLVAAHLGLSDETMKQMNKTKQYVVSSAS